MEFAKFAWACDPEPSDAVFCPAPRNYAAPASWRIGCKSARRVGVSVQRSSFQVDLDSRSFVAGCRGKKRLPIHGERAWFDAALF